MSASHLRKRKGASKALAGSMALLLCAIALETRGDELSELRERLDMQERRIAELERQLQRRDGHNETPDSPVPVAKARSEGFSIQAADGVSTLRLRGVVHFDGRYFPDDVTPAIADTWVLRRARPILEGALGSIGDFRFTPEFGGGRSTILDAFLSIRPVSWLSVTAGKFKVPVGLERIMPATDLRFIERGFPTSLVPNRDLGVQLSGEPAGGVVSYSIGYFNGVSDGGSSESNTPASDAENDTSADWAGRIFVRPFLNGDDSALRGLGFGVGATYGNSTGTTGASLLPGYRTPGQQTFFAYRDGTFADGVRLRLAPQFYYYLGPVGVLGEYVEVSQDVTRATPTARLRSAELHNNAWQLQLAWLVTGEAEAFKGSVEPISAFSLAEHGWGAFELVARYHVLDVDDGAFTGGTDSFADPASAASKARAWGIGINWYLNSYYKWSLNYDHTRFNGGDSSGADRADEQALLTRFAIAF